jgi:hypothetical protein
LRIHPDGKIELLSQREARDIIARALNDAAAEVLGGRRNVPKTEIA